MMTGGQAVDRINAILSARDMVDWVVAECEAASGRLAGFRTQR